MNISYAQAVKADGAHAKSCAAAAEDRYKSLISDCQQPEGGEVAELQAVLAELRTLPSLPLSAEQAQSTSVPVLAGLDEQHRGAVAMQCCHTL